MTISTVQEVLKNSGNLRGTSNVDGMGAVSEPEIVAFVDVLELELVEIGLPDSKILQQLIGSTRED